MHVYIDRALDSSSMGRARLAAAIAARYGLGEAQVSAYLAQGRFRIQAGIAEAAAAALAAELEAMGASVSIVDADSGATVRATPRPGGAFESGLKAAQGAGAQSGVALGALSQYDAGDPATSPVTLTSLDGSDEVTVQTSASNLRPPSPSAARYASAPVPAMATPPPPNRPPAPGQGPTARIQPDRFVPATNGEDVPLELAVAPKQRSGMLAPAPPVTFTAASSTSSSQPVGSQPTLAQAGLQAAGQAVGPQPSGPQPASAQPAGNQPVGARAPGPAPAALRPQRVGGGATLGKPSLSERLAARPGLRSIAGAVLALGIGYLPAQLYASAVESKRMDAVVSELRTYQAQEFSVDEWTNELPRERRRALERLHAARTRIAVESAMLWVVVGGIVGFAWYRKTAV